MVVPEWNPIPLPALVLNGALQVLQTLQNHTLLQFGWCPLTHKQSVKVNRLVEYLGKVSFNIFWNIIYPSLYYHSVKVSASNLFAPFVQQVDFFRESP